MKVIGINGSPRKGWNTSTLVDEALEGARSKGAETERVDLYDLDFMGCRSCFACKRVGLEDHRCTYRDGLTPVLERVREADALVLGTPIYLYRRPRGSRLSWSACCSRRSHTGRTCPRSARGPFRPRSSTP